VPPETSSKGQVHAQVARGCEASCTENSRKRGFYFSGKKSRKQIMPRVREMKKGRDVYGLNPGYVLPLLHCRRKKTFFRFIFWLLVVASHG